MRVRRNRSILRCDKATVDPEDTARPEESDQDLLYVMELFGGDRMKRDLTPGQSDLFNPGPKVLVPGADLCAPKHHGADTSVAAFISTPESTRQRQRDQVLSFIRARGSSGSTCEEASLVLEIPYTAASARCTELQRLDLIHAGSERRKTTHGKTARVYLQGPPR